MIRESTSHLVPQLARRQLYQSEPCSLNFSGCGTRACSDSGCVLSSAAGLGPRPFAFFLKRVISLGGPLTLRMHSHQLGIAGVFHLLVLLVYENFELVDQFLLVSLEAILSAREGKT